MRIVHLAVLGFVLAAPVCAQVSSAELSGTVSDQSGAVVANARVTVTLADTKIVRVAVTNSGGHYEIRSLQAGIYDVTAEAPGFKKVVMNGIELQVNQTVDLPVKLELGLVTESIEVTTTAPQLESLSSSLGSVVNTALVADLPVNLGNFLELAVLSPGVSGVGYNTTGAVMGGTRPDDKRPGSEIFSNGMREGSNNFLYDGINNNVRTIQSIVLRPSVEAIKEFKVETNLYSADLGRNSGSVIDVISKSGTDTVHGSAFEFLRNSYFDARSFFNTKPQPFPSFRYNQFGGSLGGPVMLPRIYNGRNKTFFFIDYEGFRQSQFNSTQVTIPTLAERTGDFSALPAVIYDPATTTTNPVTGISSRTPFPGKVIPTARFDPLTRMLINAYPQPLNAGLINNYTANVAPTLRWDQADARMDHQFSPNDTFFARWSIQQTSAVTPNTYPATTLPGESKPVALGNEDSFAGSDFMPVQHVVADLVHVFSPRWLNDLRAGFVRFVTDYTAEGATPGANLGNAFGIKNSDDQPGIVAFPIISPSGYEGIGQSRSLPIYRAENTYEAVDDLTFAQSSHTLKMGVDFVRRQVTEFQGLQAAGRFNFSAGFTSQPGVNGTGDSMASFLLGYPTLDEQDFALVFPGLRMLESGLYFADDWRVSKRLTLNLGLRWEYFSPYSEVAGRLANFDPSTLQMLIPGQNGTGATDGVPRDFRGFAPRFGFAYRLLSHTVMRGGYGIFNNPNGSSNGYLREWRNYPFGVANIITPGDITLGPRLSDGFPPAPVFNLAAAANPQGAVYANALNYRNAYSHEFNFTIEQEFTPLQALLKVSYVGNLGRHLNTDYNLNQPVPGPGSTNSRRPFYAEAPLLGDVTYSVSDGLSNYNALQLSVDKRLSHGLSMLLSYTLSHSIDNTGLDFGSNGLFAAFVPPQDPRCRNCDRGNSATDQRQRLTWSAVYLLPGFRHGLMGAVLGGWHVNAILQRQTGLPFTPTLQTNTVNTGTVSRPNLTGNPVLSNPTIAEWFNPAAFTSPALYTYGNAGRDTLFGPGRTNLDASLLKDFRIHERLTLELRAEEFNVLNHPQFGLPNSTIGNAQAGVISSTVGNPREMQMALHLLF